MALVVFFSLEIFVNFDCGAIPCTLSRMADEFRLSPTWQGMLGALPYVGLTVTAPFAGRIFAQWRAKRVLVVSMTLNAIATLMMVLTLCLPRDVPSTTSTLAATTAGTGGNEGPHLEVVDITGASPALLSAQTGPKKDNMREPSFHLPDFSFVELTSSAVMLLVSRLLVGLTQAPFVIYAPVWVDEFAPRKQAALWMGIMQGSAVVGVTVGYLSAGVLSVYLDFNWRAAIGVQIVFLCLLIAIVSIFPKEYIDTPGSSRSLDHHEPCFSPSEEAGVFEQEAQREGQHEPEGQQEDPGDGDPLPASAVVELASGCADCRSSDLPTSQQQGYEVQQQRHTRVETGLPLTPARASEAHRRRSTDGRVHALAGCAAARGPLYNATPRVHSTHKHSTLTLLMTPMYVTPMLTLCALLFVVTGVQFWGTIFFTSSLGLSPTVAMLTFAAVAATSPVAGVVMGGVTVDAVGGYKTLSGRRRTLYACTAYATAAVITAVIGSFSSNTYMCVGSLWFLLYFGAAMLPPLTGIQIDAVSPRLRTLASGVSMFFYNILGYALGAFLPGVFIDLFHGGDILGLRLVLLWSSFGLFFVAITAVYARHMEKQRGGARPRVSSRELVICPDAVILSPGATPLSDTGRRVYNAQGFLPIIT
ncbi:uncharacterized protein LOC34619748 [Cyclospora cayetanensis]|uniref:Uncharacterized protein LOC34619748 n=1 Tax=Cyclospora cayetanensis TaxID=88456 RepID=A0A6P6RZU2_9EIME|nr:uncharacterized protein LOC34619748 [Cyclospora cayetanensis]